MKRLYVVLVSLIMVSACFLLTYRTLAKNTGTKENLVSPNLVISQFQTAGGNSNDEFIELHNTSSNSVDLNGYRVVYRSSSGTNDVNFAAWTTSTIVPPGGYYLITSTGYDGTTPGNFTYNPGTCACALSGSSGGLAIRFGDLNSGVIIDSVGYGSATNAFVETAVTNAPSANAGQNRIGNGCQDTDNNAGDFSTLTPAAPKNSATSPNTCGGSSSTLLANGSANPATVAPNASTLLTVSVFAATDPPSTGISVTGNLTNIGGAASQQFYDDGTNGDAAAGDNVYSYLATISGNTAGGPTSVSATVTDAQARSVNVTINLAIDAPLPGENPLLFGNPSNATSNIANENNYLMTKAQYTLSYNRSKATSNWVAWRLDSSWFGSAPRQNDFRPDPALPANWYHVTDTDYSGSGYTRGHMCSSGERTRSIPDNSATFLMTNMIPQIADNNSGSWNDFENYLRQLANEGKEIYTFSGGAGNIGTIAGGKIVVPAVTWKVVLILENGNDDLQRVNKSTRTIAIIVPNQEPLNSAAKWREFRTSVDAVEYLTGYDFFSKIPKITQELIERRRDYQ